MISRLDDYCIHQTPDYVRVPGTTDRNFYDRYFFNGYRTDGSLSFGAAFGRYPNRFVQDAHFTFVVDGIQRSLHASDALGGDPADAVVGPLRVEVLEPMRVLRLAAPANEHGIRYDLVFRAETGAIDEGRRTTARRDRAAVRRIELDREPRARRGSARGGIHRDARLHDRPRHG